MPVSLDSLPFDILHLIVSTLDVCDYIHLSGFGRCQSLLENESLARRTLLVNFWADDIHLQVRADRCT